MHFGRVCRSASSRVTFRQVGARPLSRSQIGLSSYPPHIFLTPWPLHNRPLFTRVSPDSAVRLIQPRQATFTWSIALIAVVIGSAAVVQFIYSPQPVEHPDSRVQAQLKPERTLEQDYTGEIDRLKMSADNIESGHVGTLTEEQEAKLREMWMVLFKLGGVKFENPELAGDTASIKSQVPQSPISEKKKSRRSFFGLGGGNDSDATSNGAATDLANLSLSDADDKYGQNKEFQHALANKTPEEIRDTFWSMVKHDNPDALLLRFLRARKWDVNKAIVMLVSTIRWRADEMHVDDEIMYGGEFSALEASKGSDHNAKRHGGDFMAQLRVGKSFIHGVDKQGRPLCLIRVRLHKIGGQSTESLERFTVHMIETARIMLPPPIETAVIIFDMTGFTLANMDYTPVKFIIKCFEANYPESLGAILIHQAPWIFSGIWKIIKGWLDPVVAAKVHFTNSLDDLEVFIPRNRIIKELGGEEEFEYKYIEPDPNENDAMKDTVKRDEIQARNKALTKELQDATQAWIVAASKNDKDTVASEKAKRNALIEKTSRGYWEIDPYIRARTFYDRTGVLRGEGNVSFYPDRTGDEKVDVSVIQGNGFAAPTTTTDPEKTVEQVPVTSNGSVPEEKAAEVVSETTETTAVTAAAT